MKFINFGLLLIIFTRAKAEQYCSSESLGYPCCPFGTKSIYTDEFGDWAMIGDAWCIIDKCWASEYGYSCCEEGIEGNYFDKYGVWYVENDEIKCGVPNGNCWSSELGYTCCEEGVESNFFDKYGEWYVENGHKKCAIPERQCWSAEFGYPCCEGDEKANLFDEFGDWYAEDGQKVCGTQNGECWGRYHEIGRISCCDPSIKDNLIADENGEWFFMNDSEYCVIRDSKANWNDRASVKETQKDWEAFKVKWDTDYKLNYERLSVFVGEDESYVNFGWYSTTNTLPVICWGTTETLEDCTEYSGTITEHYQLKGQQYYSNKVTVPNLKPNSVYYYQRKLNGQWEEEVIEFKTQDPENFKFIFVGDPQIGGSHNRVSRSPKKRYNIAEGVRNDAYNWNVTVYNSFEYTKNPSIFISLGDQVETMASERTEPFFLEQESEYSAFLLPHLLKTLPTATLVGNHDCHTNNYRHHFNTPNSYTAIPNINPPGYNYYFKYNNALVVALESNWSFEEDYLNVIEEAVSKYPDTDWRIAMFHHNAYGNGSMHSQDPENINLRKILTPVLDRLNFSLVLNAHDHVYTASKFITYSSDSRRNGYDVSPIEQGKAYYNPEGTLYITSNCSTASKLNGFLYEEFDYVNFYNQTFSSTFGVMDFQKTEQELRLTVTILEAEGYRVVDGPYIIVKTRDDSGHGGEEKCWAEALGYPCCTLATTAVIYVDESGPWGVEEDQWCGIEKEEEEEEPKETTATTTATTTTVTTPTTPITSTSTTTISTSVSVNTSTNATITTTTTTTTMITETPVLSPECWAEALGYPCCRLATTAVIYVDESGPWGIEEDQWCGIEKKEEEVEEPKETTTTTSATTITVTTPITSTSTTTISTSVSVNTSTIATTITTTTTTTTMITETPVLSPECWAEALGYPCCTLATTAVIYVDESGPWGVEEDQWCGIEKEEEEVEPKETTTTTTAATTITTTTTMSTTPITTTSTLSASTTTVSPEPMNCAPDYGQCGGEGYEGASCCAHPEFRCVRYNESYHQCVPQTYH